MRAGQIKRAAAIIFAVIEISAILRIFAKRTGTSEEEMCSVAVQTVYCRKMIKTIRT